MNIRRPAVFSGEERAMLFASPKKHYMRRKNQVECSVIKKIFQNLETLGFHEDCDWSK
jgi:hypothetical protein